jgi:hypothetical protein
MPVYTVRWNCLHARTFLSCGADGELKVWDEAKTKRVSPGTIPALLCILLMHQAKVLISQLHITAGTWSVTIRTMRRLCAPDVDLCLSPFTRCCIGMSCSLSWTGTWALQWATWHGRPTPLPPLLL